MSKVPFNLDLCARKAYFPMATAEHAQVSGQKAGDKRFGTMQICVHPGTAVQPRLAVIFAGAGKVPHAEKFGYHPHVDVYFQQKAWADEDFCKDWATQTLRKWVDETQVKEFVLFGDNLGSQRMMSYVDVVHNLGGKCAYGPVNKTEGWQPIDAGYAYEK